LVNEKLVLKRRVKTEKLGRSLFVFWSKLVVFFTRFFDFPRFLNAIFPREWAFFSGILRIDAS